MVSSTITIHPHLPHNQPLRLGINPQPPNNLHQFLHRTEPPNLRPQPANLLLLRGIKLHTLIVDGQQFLQIVLEIVLDDGTQVGVLVGVEVLLVLLDEVADGEELLGELVFGKEDALGDGLGDLVHLRRVQSLLMPVPPAIPPTTEPVTPEPSPCPSRCPLLLPLLNRVEQLLVVMLIQPLLQLEQLRDLNQRLLLLTIDDVLVLGGVATRGELGALVLGGVVALDATETTESVAAVFGV